MVTRQAGQTAHDKRYGVADTQVREACGVQCESDLTFQRGQVQQSYIGTVCAQLQRNIGHYLTTTPAWQAVPEGVQEGAVHLVLTLAEVQADLLALAPHTCITQVSIMPALNHRLCCQHVHQAVL